MPELRRPGIRSKVEADPRITSASLVVGSSLVMTVSGGPEVLGVALLTWLGRVRYLVALVNSVWIIVSIGRSGRE